MSMLTESLVIALVIGGVMGAITALHLLGPKKIALKIHDKQRLQQRH